MSEQLFTQEQLADQVEALQRAYPAGRVHFETRELDGKLMYALCAEPTRAGGDQEPRTLIDTDGRTVTESEADLRKRLGYEPLPAVGASEFLTPGQIDCCRRSGRDEAGRSSTIGLTELDALCDTAAEARLARLAADVNLQRAARAEAENARLAAQLNGLRMELEAVKRERAAADASWRVSYDGAVNDAHNHAALAREMAAQAVEALAADALRHGTGPEISPRDAVAAIRAIPLSPDDAVDARFCRDGPFDEGMRGKRLHELYLENKALKADHARTWKMVGQLNNQVVELADSLTQTARERDAARELAKGLQQRLATAELARGRSDEADAYCARCGATSMAACDCAKEVAGA